MAYDVHKAFVACQERRSEEGEIGLLDAVRLGKAISATSALTFSIPASGSGQQCLGFTRALDAPP